MTCWIQQLWWYMFVTSRCHSITECYLSKDHSVVTDNDWAGYENVACSTSINRNVLKRRRAILNDVAFILPNNTPVVVCVFSGRRGGGGVNKLAGATKYFFHTMLSVHCNALLIFLKPQINGEIIHYYLSDNGRNNHFHHRYHQHQCHTMHYHD